MKPSLAEGYLKIDNLLRSLRGRPRGKDGVRRFTVTKERFLSLKEALRYNTSDRQAQFFKDAEENGVEFGLYDNIAVMSGIAGPYYKDAADKDHILILVRS